MQYTSTVIWKRNELPFTVKNYDRTYTVRFGGGLEIEGSSAPEFLGKAALPNPEELFISAIASCFMLTFLYWAAMKNLVINQYTITGTGQLGKNAEGKMAMTEVKLKPEILFEQHQTPDATLLDELFKKAHENCFISCSVKTKINIESALVTG